MPKAAVRRVENYQFALLTLVLHVEYWKLLLRSSLKSLFLINKIRTTPFQDID